MDLCVILVGINQLNGRTFAQLSEYLRGCVSTNYTWQSLILCGMAVVHLISRNCMCTNCSLLVTRVEPEKLEHREVQCMIYLCCAAVLCTPSSKSVSTHFVLPSQLHSLLVTCVYN